MPRKEAEAGSGGRYMEQRGSRRGQRRERHQGREVRQHAVKEGVPGDRGPWNDSREEVERGEKEEWTRIRR